mmetsp:Transcript_5292/g.17176  ORF Transcript_5292/g.17176 Transcript_5292/m.17176 type:complete len:254 (-) Transcript_5292:1603-2364(-)
MGVYPPPLGDAACTCTTRCLSSQSVANLLRPEPNRFRRKKAPWQKWQKCEKLCRREVRQSSIHFKGHRYGDVHATFTECACVEAKSSSGCWPLSSASMGWLAPRAWTPTPWCPPSVPPLSGKSTSGASRSDPSCRCPSRRPTCRSRWHTASPRRLSPGCTHVAIRHSAPNPQACRAGARSCVPRPPARCPCARHAARNSCPPNANACGRRAARRGPSNPTGRPSFASAAPRRAPCAWTHRPPTTSSRPRGRRC